MRRLFDAPATLIVRDSLLFMIFFSLLTGFIEATYTFGLLGTDIPPEIVCVLFLFSPFLLLLAPRSLDSRRFAIIMGGLAIAAWATSLPLDTRWRMLATGAGCGSFLVFLACRIRQSSIVSAEHGGALGLGVLLSILLRSLSSGNLLLVEGWRFAAGVALAAVAFILLIAAREPRGQVDTSAARFGFPRTLGLCLGLFGALLVIYLAFTSPTVIARWGAVSCTAVTAVETGALVLFLGAWFAVPGFRNGVPPAALGAGNLLFILSLALTLLLRQPPFTSTTVYPLFMPAPDLPARVSFWAMLAFHPVIYADAALLAGALRLARPSPRWLAAGFGLGGVLILFLSLGQIFTTVYDYIPVIGPLFRNRFWLVMVVPAVLAAVALLLVKRNAPVGNRGTSRPIGWLAATLIIAGASILLSGVSSPRPVPAAAATSIRALTYNIQQGYGKSGEKSFARQRELIGRLGPDIVGIEESDTARAAGGNSDIVRYFADGLGLYSYYGPTPISGTFGIALLSRYPIRNARTFFMPSRGEQTACIEADIAVGDSLVHVLVTHLDNEGALPQQRLVIDRAIAGGRGRVVTLAMGDFNFNSTTEQYRQTMAAMDDSWRAAKERIVDPGASDPAGRIDHIFVAPNTRVLSARYIAEGPSDHPGMLVEVAW
jgi:endonuclease/exonuclease/phosphatase family metal-dependent hydrolase